jgi:plastocyanin
MPDFRRSVVYLESAPRGAFEPSEAGRAVIDQRNERFVPHVLAVMVGTVVDFPNSDLTYHNVFSLSRAKLDQRNEAFVPHVLAIVAGTTVDFPNNDRTYHNVFSLSPTKPFDLGRYAVGRSKAVKFDRPGIVRVFCDIHSHMSAFILVFAHRHFAVTDDEGRYRLDNVPPGTYTLIAWNESAPSDSRRVMLPAAGAVEVNFALGRR